MSKMEKFAAIWQRAAQRKGGDQALQALLPPPPKAVLEGDDRLLSALSAQIFKSGFVWRVVDDKWPAFEEAFWGFDPHKLVMMSPEQLDQRMHNPALIRHGKKMQAVLENAQMILDLAQHHGSFGHWLARWPGDNITGLWGELKRRGARLGGNTGPYFLRRVGKDTFLMTGDVTAYLQAHKLIEGSPGSKRSLEQAQRCFNIWQMESGLPLASISRVLSCSVGDNRLGRVPMDH
ncbi:DNA-3-methyladenine glycosylase I [Ferrimonas sediminicola]|uniref:DNA-3-methyladenine glycosylase I n=1 Tax=Ferrimonas sediminicola TaxID=2569538 RepID=A0A4U1BE80_9GAMM|nr:DNA-3-methyladenine glycosylase I [Ferrimonas sediminicola]TKB48937.1 DNA-3-methyladenine glycosylase I [Ferrimonas sediminicola]